jgi:hypothetical protein
MTYLTEDIPSDLLHDVWWLITGRTSSMITTDDRLVAEGTRLPYNLRTMWSLNSDNECTIQVYVFPAENHMLESVSKHIFSVYIYFRFLPIYMMLNTWLCKRFLSNISIFHEWSLKHMYYIHIHKMYCYLHKYMNGNEQQLMTYYEEVDIIKNVLKVHPINQNLYF